MFLGTAFKIPSHRESIIPGIGSRAAGRTALLRWEKEGMRSTIDPVVRWGKSDARATGRKAARNEREGAAEMAAIVCIEAKDRDWRMWSAVCDAIVCRYAATLLSSLDCWMLGKLRFFHSVGKPGMGSGRARASARWLAGLPL